MCFNYYFRTQSYAVTVYVRHWHRDTQANTTTSHILYNGRGIFVPLVCRFFLLSQQKLIKLRNKYVNALIPVSNIYIYSFNSCFLLCCFYLILPLDSYHTHQYYIILYDSMHNLDAMPHFGNFLQKGLPI